MKRRVGLLGVDFDDTCMALVLEMLLARAEGASFGYVVTPNADHIGRLRRLPELQLVYRAAWLCLLDSRVLYLLAGGLGLRRPAHVTGAALTAALLPRLRGTKVAVVGMAPPAFAALRRHYPQINFIHHEPPMGLLYDPLAFAVARDFAVTAQAGFVFFALGSPVQELLAHAVLMRGATGTGLCIGAALEFCTGLRRRAPPWMQRIGLEWLYRLVGNPARFAGRYLLDGPPVIAALMLDAVRRWLRA